MEKATAEPMPAAAFSLPLSRGCCLLVPRPLGVTLFKVGNCHPQIVAPPD